MNDVIHGAVSILNTAKKQEEVLSQSPDVQHIKKNAQEVKNAVQTIYAFLMTNPDQPYVKAGGMYYSIDWQHSIRPKIDDKFVFTVFRKWRSNNQCGQNIETDISSFQAMFYQSFSKMSEKNCKLVKTKTIPLNALG